MDGVREPRELGALSSERATARRDLDGHVFALLLLVGKSPLFDTAE
jgi:hypothetical protein